MVLPATSRTRSPQRPGLVERHPFGSFVALAYGFSWSFMLLGCVVDGPLWLLAVFGPAVAGVVVMRRPGGDLREWARSCVRWRVPLRWWAYALGLPVLLFGAVSLSLQVLGHPVDWSLALDRAPAYAATWLFVLVIGGAAEEPGWRGFGLPYLLERHTPVRATLILGVVWGFWHLPVYGPLGFVVPTILAFFYTFLWARTRSVLLAIVLHASFTPAQDHLILMRREQAYSSALDAPDFVILGVYLAAVAVLLVATRGRLGVPPSPASPVRDRPDTSAASQE